MLTAAGLRLPRLGGAAGPWSCHAALPLPWASSTGAFGLHWATRAPAAAPRRRRDGSQPGKGKGPEDPAPVRLSGPGSAFLFKVVLASLLVSRVTSMVLVCKLMGGVAAHSAHAGQPGMNMTLIPSCHNLTQRVHSTQVRYFLHSHFAQTYVSYERSMIQCKAMQWVRACMYGYVRTSIAPSLR